MIDIEEQNELEKEQDEGEEVRKMATSKGWQIVDRALDEALERLDMNRRISDDPHVVLSCSKKSDGIMLVKETIGELIKAGEEASLELTRLHQ